MDSGGSGGYDYYYIYSFKKNNLKEIFNFDKYNIEFKYKVDYSDLYKVEVGNDMLDKLFVLDISYKGYDYLSQYYDENGKLKKPVQGEVLALSSLYKFNFFVSFIGLSSTIHYHCCLSYIYPHSIQLITLVAYE